MTLFLRWQAKEIALYSQMPGEEPAEDILLSRMELDFELGPVALTSDEDYQRLLAALVQLRADAGAEEQQVDLLIPASWGVTHHVPNPSLSDEDLREHLRWELSKSLIDTEDQYRYNFASDVDGEIIITALRLRLLERIQQVIQESGFQLLGLFLEGDPWMRVNLIGVAEELAEVSGLRSVKDEVVPPPPKESKPTFERRAPESQRRWFFPVVLALGLIIVVVFAWVKLTGEKKPGALPEPVAQVQEVAPARTDTVMSPAGRPGMPPSHPAPAEDLWADMSRRVDLIQQALSVLDEGCGFDLISFTEDRFLYQLVTPGMGRLDEAITKVKNFPGLEDVKSSVSPPLDDLSRGVVSGRLTLKTPIPALKTPVQAEIIRLGKRQGLTNKALIFTGTKQAVLSFLSDVASEGYAVYRLILVPWEDDEYRAVLEL